MSDMTHARFHLPSVARWILVTVLSTVAVTAGIRAADPRKLIASLGGGGNASSCPDDMTEVLSPTGNFCIDRFEASAGESCPHAAPGTQAQTRANLDIQGCMPVSAEHALPWRAISQHQAATACAKAGKRLPTNHEWYLAALGTPDLGEGWGPDDCHVADNWSERPGRTGTGARCVSAVGAYDLVGNVWEWTGDTAEAGVVDGTTLPADGYVAEVNGRGVPTAVTIAADPNFNADTLRAIRDGVRGILRGGYWKNASDAGVYTMNGSFSPATPGEAVGFRCVR